MSRNHSRTPPPRQLGAKETLESLSHWQTTFRTFYKKDDSYKTFFKKDQKWNHLRPNYDLNDEPDGEKRSAADLAEDLTDLLNTLAGYLPHSYLTDKILKSSKCWTDVWRIIHDHYNVQVTSETLLDFESLHKLSEETHRQFFERLLQHAKQHLAPANVKVESLTNLVPDIHDNLPHELCRSPVAKKSKSSSHRYCEDRILYRTPLKYPASRSGTTHCTKY